MKTKYLLKRIKISFWDNRGPLAVLCLWFLGGFLIYFLIVRISFIDALKASFFLHHEEHDLSSGYEIWSNGIIFGVVFSMLLQNMIGKYNPERGCRMMAQEMHDHLVIVGYSHLGERLVSYARQANIAYCLIEKDKDKVDELLREGEPVVIDNAQEADALKDANIAQARAVIVASNNLETALIVTKRARELNKHCRIVARCFQDEFTEILESLGANEVISSSKNAFDDIIRLMPLA